MKTRMMLSVAFFILLFAACDVQKNKDGASDTGAATDTLQEHMIIHARVFVKPDHVADFVTAAKAMVDSSNMEPGCISYQLFRHAYDSTQFIFVEEWKDQAAIDAHFAMPYFVTWGPKTNEWMAKPAELNIFNASSK
ncbi:MAG: antibiotic biosynthesis monooxygenase [Bacteroidales bacterium]|nr:antibiotic biosynthesis monooxygenase [Bacteroidales bacterium]